MKEWLKKAMPGSWIIAFTIFVFANIHKVIWLHLVRSDFHPALVYTAIFIGTFALLELCAKMIDYHATKVNQK